MLELEIECKAWLKNPQKGHGERRHIAGEPELDICALGANDESHFPFDRKNTLDWRERIHTTSLKVTSPPYSIKICHWLVERSVFRTAAKQITIGGNT